MQSSQNFLIVIRFLGTNYHGWQIQDNALSVQEIFQKSLFKVTKSKTNLKSCSRTDSGVHANVFCINTKINVNINEKNLTLAINNFLPGDIRVTKCYKVSENFHARYSCIAKEYVYKIYNNRVMDPFLKGRYLHFWYPLNINLMNELASVLVGEHNFSSFCSSDNRQKENMIRQIYHLNICKIDNNIIEFRIKSDGFLYNMVRIIVGTILEGNYRKYTISDMKNILSKKNRSYAGKTVPAYGLYLDKVFYKDFIIC